MYGQTPTRIDSLINSGKYFEVIAEYGNVDETKPDTEKVKIYSALSFAYFYTMKYEQSKVYTIKSYELYEKFHDNRNTNRMLITLGTIHITLGDYANAKYYLDKALATNTDKNNLYYIYIPYVEYYLNMKDYVNARKYIDLCLGLNPVDHYANMNLAKYYECVKDSVNAKRVYKYIVSLKPDELMKNECYMSIANLSDVEDAKMYVALISDEILSYKISKYRKLLDVYKAENNIDSVYYYAKQIINLKDSVTKHNNSELAAQMSAEFNSKYHVQQAEHEVELKTEHNHILNIIIVICIIVIFTSVGGFFWVKRQKEIKEKLSNELSHKNREIMDSINYAQGIQQSILPADLGPGVSVLFNPKDIVSGDFYWSAIKGHKRYYVVADCTGHGVPGALMSMLCSQLLNQAITVCTSPKQIVDWTETKLNEMMSDMNRNDSMEFGVICVEDKTVTYYGLKRPLYISTSAGVEVFKPKDVEYQKELSTGDTLYITTDGFVDQFGTINKKYGSGRFKAFLETLRGHEVESTRDTLQLEIETWMGQEEQTDDILVMGIQIL